MLRQDLVVRLTQEHLLNDVKVSIKAILFQVWFFKVVLSLLMYASQNLVPLAP